MPLDKETKDRISQVKKEINVVEQRVNSMSNYFKMDSHKQELDDINEFFVKYYLNPYTHPDAHNIGMACAMKKYAEWYHEQMLIKKVNDDKYADRLLERLYEISGQRIASMSDAQKQELALKAWRS